MPGPRVYETQKTTAPPAHDLDFPPVQNGVDYLNSACFKLGHPTPRNLKYAVLHLQAATEVLLKARLQQEHWSLVFKDPGLATRQRFEVGDFESCTTAAALARLKDIAGVAVDDKSAKSLAILSKWRNAIQHYGLKTQARAVEARAAQVLDFLVAFVHDHLLPALPKSEADELDKQLYIIRSSVRRMQAFSDTRRKRLSSELDDHKPRTVQCPDCSEWALVVGEGWVKLSCRFCHTTWRDPGDLLIYYVLLHGVEPDDVSEVCPNCHQLGLLVGCTLVADAPGDLATLCFGCGEAFNAVATCSGCADRYVPGENDGGVCRRCIEWRSASTTEESR
ncbi:hypothetical protein ACLB9X_27685 [Streptomyces sp. 5K101]|uniref:hypothetical protein n=1 Tax=Streptomyces sp. 5K101 TaxID=3390037 RepID=UPI003974F664